MFRKRTIFLFVLLLTTIVITPTLAAPLSAPTTISGGSVSGTWDIAGSPYLIDGDITIPAGATLTIEPGVEVLFQSWYSLTVNGTLNADGTQNAPILFGGGHETAGWLGIRFIDAPDGSSLTYAIVENGSATGADPLNKGGGLYIENSNPVISYSTIRNNHAKYSGGGIYLNNSDATLIGNTIINNTAGYTGGSANGGGVTILNSNPIVKNNNISGNSVSISGLYVSPSGYGGGLYVRSSNTTFTGNLISDNHVYGNANSYARGGGLYLYYGAPNFINNTITGNSAFNEATGVYAVVEGGGIYTYHSSPTFVNNILWNDKPQEIFAAMVSGTSTYTFSHNDLEGGLFGIVPNGSVVINNEGGNLKTDPRFVDPNAGDFSLMSTSPLIDAGIAYFEWNGNVLVDLDSSEYNGSAPDMGAFEFGGGGTPNQAPVAVASAAPDHGSAPLTVQFSSADSYDPDGTLVGFFWDFGDGSTSNEANPTYTYTSAGIYQAALTVTDDDGAAHTNVISVDVQDGTTIYAGDVSGVWDAAGSPYRVEGDITVPAGQTLTIGPGVEVNFQSWYKLTVNGTLQANGTAGSPILFTSDSVPSWLGIRFIDSPDGSVLDHVIVEKGRATGASPYNSGGGIYIQNSSPTISNSIIRDNYAKSSGGGIYLDGSNARLIGNTITNNQAGMGGSAYGGGIYMTNSNPEITGNVISNNLVYISGTFVTPYGLGGGIYASNSNPTLSGNLIQGNVIDGGGSRYARGGAIYLASSDADLINNTITGNTVGTGGTFYIVLEGGGIYANGSDLVIANSILWNDTPQEIFVANGAVVSTITAAYSDVQGGQFGIVTNGNAVINWLEGNINTDPLFADAPNADFTLSVNSPAVDTGTAFFEWGGRILVNLDATEYNGNAPDMGTFESRYSGGGSNQSPVAVASADLTSGEAPLTVQFSSAGSNDSDGTITAFAWNFGDGATSNGANPSHTYTSPGTYQAVLVVTDNNGATDSASVTITVNQMGQDELHVEAQTVSRFQLNRRNWRGMDTILITDQNNMPVAGVTVTVAYTGPNQGQVSGITKGDGTVTLYTDRARDPQGNWCFEVIEVTKDGYVYNPDANVVVLQCE